MDTNILSKSTLSPTIDSLIKNGLIWHSEQSDSAQSDSAQSDSAQSDSAQYKYNSAQREKDCIKEASNYIPAKSLHDNVNLEIVNLKEIVTYLTRGTIHEWISNNTRIKSVSELPRGVIAVIACSIYLSFQLTSSHTNNTKKIIWLGEDTWPSPLFLASVYNLFYTQIHKKICSEDIFNNALFIKTNNRKEKIKTMRTLLSSSAVSLVISSVSNLLFKESLILQQAAANGGSVGFILRPWQEKNKQSAANTRWEVTPTIPPTKYLNCFSQSWNIRLQKKKGIQPSRTTWQICHKLHLT